MKFPVARKQVSRMLITRVWAATDPGDGCCVSEMMLLESRGDRRGAKWLDMAAVVVPPDRVVVCVS